MFSLDELEDIYKRENTLVKVIQPVQKGKGYIQTNFPIEVSNTFGVDVIPGDTKLSLAEDFLSKDWLDGKAGDARGLQTTFVFKDLLLKLKDNYDYIFFDVGPSLGALNRAVLVASDLYIVPMSSDIFSLRAIENISKSMTDWKGQLQRGLDDYQYKEDECFMLNQTAVKWNLEFIGYIAQQYTAKTNDGVKRPVNAYEKIIKKIPTVIEKHLVTNSAKIKHIKLGEIPNLNCTSLI